MIFLRHNEVLRRQELVGLQAIYLLPICLLFKEPEQKDSLGALFTEAFSVRSKHRNRLIKSRSC